MIRSLLLSLAFCLGAAANVQAQGGFSAAVGGGYGSGGTAGRIALGYERASYTAALRVAADGLFVEAPNAPGLYQQKNVELGVALGRQVSLSRSVGLVLSAGLAYGITGYDDANEPSFLENIAYTLQLPIEADVVISLDDRVGLSAGGYWSQGIARVSGGGLADNESTNHGGLLFGVRLTP